MKLNNLANDDDDEQSIFMGLPISCSSAKQHIIFGNNNNNVLRVRLDHVLTGKGKIMGATFFINVCMQLHLYVEPKTCFYIMFTLS